VPKNDLPPPSLTLTKPQARRFLLAHQRLWPPRQLPGKTGVLDYIRHAGCIQFDPIQVVGRNADLVLQARVAGYRPAWLQELLYAERQLLDGWDKVAAIHLTSDWPYFARTRAAMRQRHGGPEQAAMAIAPAVLQAIRERGPLASGDLGHDGRIDWFWGQPIRLARATLETLYYMGELVIHHRVGTQRVFELAERLLPAELLAAPDPNPGDADYQDWHVLRRVGGLGLANPGATEYWLGILDVKSEARRAALRRLVERGQVAAVAVEELPGRVFFMRAADLPTLPRDPTGSEAIDRQPPPPPQAAIVGPLDNLMWDRALLRWVFDFDYVWEVYKPAAQRRYGYYVLPVLYGDRFIARFDPAFDKRQRELTIANWWWEAGVTPDEAVQAALRKCFQEFLGYLGAERLRLGKAVTGDTVLLSAVQDVGLPMS
jgi:uncharacterized protein YcaQ